MQVIYRITSIPSTNPSPIYQDDKNKLNEFCLESFLMAFSDVKPRIIFLADNCTCKTMIIKLCSKFGYSFEIKETNHGINEAMILSYKIASKMNDYVLFQECDYLYKNTCGKTFVNALEELKLVSPYDHPNFYKDKDLHSDKCTIKLIDDHHFRSTERDTMTWGCHSSLVKDNLEMLKKHGYLDGQVWLDLLEKGFPLYVPIPSMATHMAKDWLAPNVNWDAIRK